MTTTTFRVIAITLIAFLLGCLTSAGECNIYCKNTYLHQDCNLASFFRTVRLDCQGCRGDGTSLCVDAIDQTMCKAYGDTQILFRLVDASSECPCMGAYVNTDAQNDTNPVGLHFKRWLTCDGVDPGS